MWRDDKGDVVEGRVREHNTSAVATGGHRKLGRTKAILMRPPQNHAERIPRKVDLLMAVLHGNPLTGPPSC